MKNGIRVAICVMLVVAVLAMSLSVFADNEPSPAPTLSPETDYVPAEVLWENAGCYGVWLLLDSWGITVSVDEVKQWSQETYNVLTELVLEYLDSLPSVASLYAWISPWLWSDDFWGNVRYNSTMLEDVESFANWLVTKFGLSDNSDITIGGLMSMGGVSLYECNKWYNAIQYDGYNINSNFIKVELMDFKLDGTNASTPPVYYFYANDGTNYWLVFMCGTQIYTNARQYLADIDGQNQYQYDWTPMNLNRYENPWWISDGIATYGSITVNRPSDMIAFEFSDWSDVLNFVRTGVIAQEDDYGITTTIINTPSDDDNYTPGDSIVIIDGEPNYITIEWPESIQVGNLPAIVSTGTVANPGLETFWGFIPVLAEQTSEAIVLTRGLIYELPEELVVTFYAVMGGLILFGIIKLMREH